MLVNQLPLDSATGIALHGDRAMWSPTEYLLANVVDLLATVSWQLGGKGRQPEPIDRPGQTRPGPARVDMSTEQRHARLLELQAREVARQQQLQEEVSSGRS